MAATDIQQHDDENMTHVSQQTIHVTNASTSLTLSRVGGRLESPLVFQQQQHILMSSVASRITAHHV
mgnify:CR=1 FL=1